MPSRSRYPHAEIISHSTMSSLVRETLHRYGDFRARNAPHPTLCNCGMSHTLNHGISVIADGVPQTLAAVRENLKHGATQIKIMGGGGVASDYDPIHTLQPSPDEIRAAVQAGVSFHSAAGNEAASHYQATFHPTAGSSYHDFAGAGAADNFDEITLGPGETRLLIDSTLHEAGTPCWP